MQAQQETMALSDLLFDYSGVGYFLCEADSGVIVRVNKVFADMLGMRLDEIVGKTWQALTPNDVLQQELAMLDKLRAGDEFARYEKAFLHKDGSQVPVIISYNSQPALYEGQPVLVVSVLDVSEIKAREKELSEEKHFWDFIFEHTPIGMALFDTKGRYYMVNDAYADMVEYDKQTLVDPNFDWKIPWRECLQETMEHAAQCQRTGQPVSYHSVIIAKSGRKVHCITRFFKIPSKGELQRDDLFIAFHTDISDLKARENEMQETIAYTEMLLDQLAGGYLIPDHKKAEIDAIARIQKRFNLTVSGLASLITQIMQAGEKIEGVASTLADNQKEVAKRIEDESTSLEQISASLEEMRSTTKNVAQQSDETLKVAIETDKSSEFAAAKMMELKQLIDDLGETAKTTTTILRSIADIAFTTNLLSLNASVEAARAGEHGRGFAVIAAEIRRLANKSSEDVKSIESWFDTLKQRISNGQRAMTESLAQLQGIDRKAATSKQMMEEVAQATQETESGIAQIQEALLHLEEGMQYITQESEQISVIADELLEEAHNLAAEAAEFTSDAEKTPDLLPSSDSAQENIKRLPTRP